MSDMQQTERLKAELAVMEKLSCESDILDFTVEGTPPRTYKITLHGRGISKGSPFGGDVECGDRHELIITLSHSYPKYAPDVRFVTPIFHPNVSSIGYVRLADCGLKWESDLSLDVVCQRMWDVLRGAYVDTNTSGNYSARKWYTEQTTMTLPVDPRSLRDRGEAPAPVQNKHANDAGTAALNVVRYRRTEPAKPTPAPEPTPMPEPTPPPPPAQPATPPPARPPAVRPARQAESDDVLYIGEDTAPPPAPPQEPNRQDDDNILFIGDD